MLLGNKRIIFWIDQNIENGENQKYLEKLKNEFPTPTYSIKTFISINSYESYLKKNKKDYDFKLIYFILSGRLAEKFFDNYNLLTHTNIIAATIVFCMMKEYHSSKPYANDLYLNPGGVAVKFKEVIKYIKSENDILWHNLVNINKNNIVLPEEKQNFGNTFIYAQTLTDIALPIILTEIIKKNLIQHIDIINFMSYIFAKYLNEKEVISLVKPSLEKNIYLPLKKRALFLLRLYTLEKPKFYDNLNKELTNIDGFGFYKVFILILYFAIQNKIVQSYSSGKLYRRTLISLKEMDEIIKSFENKKTNIKNQNEISSILYYSKPFLSFSKYKKIALKFAKTIKQNTARVLLIINPPKHSGEIYYSNIDLDKLNVSKYNESEVLFLPLSCFEIESYKKIGENDYEITLNYLDKYYHQLKNKISIIKQQEEMQDFYEKILDTPFSMKVIECLEDYDTIFNNIKDYLLDHSPNQEISLNYNKIIPKLPNEKLISKFHENASMKGIPSGFSNGKQLNALFNSEPVTIQLQESKYSGYKVWELKYADGSRAIIKQHPRRGDYIIIKKIDENGNLGYYDEAFRPISEEISVENTNTYEVLEHSKDFNMKEIKELSLLRSGFTYANLFGGAIGYNLANIDKFIQSSKKDKAITLGSTFGIPTGMCILSNTIQSAVPIVSASLLGGFYIYELISDIKSATLTGKETAISILKNTSNIAVNIGTGIGGFYAGLQIGVSLGIVTGPGAILIGLGSGIVGGLIGGIAGRLITSTKMVLNCNSFYKNYIPHKFREEGNIPELFWEGVNKKAKSFVLEAIIDQKYKTWCVINIPRQTRKITSDIGETLIKYGNYWHLNPNTVDYMLYSIK